MHYFFTDSQNIGETTIQISGEDLRHLQVIRLKKGEKIMIADSEKRKNHLCELISLGRDEALFRIVKTSENGSEPSIEVTLFQGMPKMDKMEWIVQKATELGVLSVVPVLMERTVKMPQSFAKQKERLEKIARASAMQSKRGHIPNVGEMVSFVFAVQETKKFDAAFMLYEEEQTLTMKQYLTTVHSCKKIAFFVGPEGGCSEKEVKIAKQEGVALVGLGKRILRTETAPLCALSILMYETENM